MGVERLLCTAEAPCCGAHTQPVWMTVLRLMYQRLVTSLATPAPSSARSLSHKHTDVHRGGNTWGWCRRGEVCLESSKEGIDHLLMVDLKSQLTLRKSSSIFATEFWVSCIWRQVGGKEEGPPGAVEKAPLCKTSGGLPASASSFPLPNGYSRMFKQKCHLRCPPLPFGHSVLLSCSVTYSVASATGSSLHPPTLRPGGLDVLGMSPQNPAS